MSSILPQPHPKYGMYYVEKELRHAAYMGDLQLAEQLTKIYPDLDLNAVDEYGRTALYIACERQQPEMITWLLNKPGIDLNRPTVRGNSPLLMAAWNDDNATVKELVEHSANIHARTHVDREYHAGVSALDIAKERGNHSLVELLTALANQALTGQKNTLFAESGKMQPNEDNIDTVTIKPTRSGG